MKFYFPSKLEMWAIALTTIVTFLLILNNRPTIAKICYSLMMFVLIFFILTNQNKNE